MQETGGKDVAEEVVGKEAVIKDETGEADASTDHYIHHISKTSRDKLMILARS